LNQKPRLLDLFCGAGGAGMGYFQAGFEVVGVDNKPQKHYPFEFHQADALEYLQDHWQEFDDIHASPPCQHYSMATLNPNNHPDLYQATVDLLIAVGKPYVVENVISAPYNSGIVLCGSMFNLTFVGEWLQRHCNFETSIFIFQPSHNHPDNKRPVTITSKTFVTETREYKHSRQTTFEIAKKLFGVDWMNRHELIESIPPAYPEWIGKQIMKIIKGEQ
jgi:DNA (cytosine-5)-methyltransferase 1